MIYANHKDFKGLWNWKNFTIKELSCGGLNGCQYCEGEYYHDPYSLDLLQSARSFVDQPFHIHSAHRCEKRNQVVGGKKSSQHLKIAFDFHVSDMQSNQLHGIIDQLYSQTAGLGLYSWGIHLDFRKNKARW